MFITLLKTFLRIVSLPSIIKYFYYYNKKNNLCYHLKEKMENCQLGVLKKC
jgi:hypothetical protein